MQQQKAKLTTTRKATVGLKMKARRGPRQGRRDGSHMQDTRGPNAPTLIPCALRGPDGKTRPGWEMWVGNLLFGRADTKECLLQYYTRIYQPMPSGHWRDQPSWQSSRQVARRLRREHYHDDYEDDTDLESELVGRWEGVDR